MTGQPDAAPGPERVSGTSVAHIPDHDLLQRIGRGGYGEVWLARNRLTNTLRAVKLVFRREFEDERPYRREFEGLLKFEPISRSHPSQLAILHVGRDEGADCFYYVMELADPAAEGSGQKSEVSGQRSDVSGQKPTDGLLTSDLCLLSSQAYRPRTLRSELKSRGRLPVAEVLELGRALTTALEHLHAHGLVHRDIKPANVVYVSGVPKLADIGLVTDASDACSIVGTEGYIPPEGPGSPPADLFSLGKVLYEAATGRDRRDYPALPDDLREWPDAKRLIELNAVLLKACASDVRGRYQSADQLRADLERLQAGGSVKRRHAWGRGGRQARRFAPVLALAALALLVLPRVMRQQVPSPANPPADKASVFVLPFRNPPGDGTGEELASRVTDGLIDSLGIIIGKEKVGPRKSGWLLKSEAEAQRSAFAQFEPKHAVSGLLSVTNGRVEVALSGYAAPQGQSEWTGQIAGSTNDLVNLEWKVVEEVAKRLKMGMPDTTRSRVLGVLSNNVAALEWCRRGEEHTWHFDLDRVTRAKEAFIMAKRLDPNCTRALGGLSWVNRILVYHRSHRESWLDIVSLAHDTLRIDDSDLGARHSIAGARVHFDWDWDHGVTEYLNYWEECPKDAGYYCNLALVERMLGRFPEARRHQAEMDKQLSEVPFGLLYTSVTAKYVDILYAERYEGRTHTQGSYDEVISRARDCQQRNPEANYGFWIEALGHLGKRDYAAALEAIHQGRSLYETQELLGLEGYAYAKMGQGEKAQSIIRELVRPDSFPQPYWLARISAALGETDKVFEWLQKAVDDRCEWLVKPDYGCGGLWLDEAWDELRSDPRFRKIKAATGLKWPGEQ